MSLRNLPSVEKVLNSGPVKGLLASYERQWLTDLARACIGESRDGVRNGHEAPSAEEIGTLVAERARRLSEVQPRRAINATGVIIHTNLGRAPLSREAIEAMMEAAQGYSNLELDLGDGRRGSRQAHLQPILQQLTGAEACLVVNNNASAVLLGLTAVAQGREVIVSRGEAVEIGGGFRVPSVLAQSGAKLVEVGTTNRTYVADYESAISENTAALLKVHASNFRVVGFTHAPETAELVALGKRRGIPALHDIGSGCLLDTRPYGLAYEPRPQDSVRDGADLVFFSGDKLLGGPQAGIIVGRKEMVDRLSSHPLARAIRIDKMSLAGLTATLLHYLKGEAISKVPVWAMIAASEAELKRRAIRWKRTLGERAQVVPSVSAIGGGSLPGETLRSWAVALDCQGVEGGADGVAARLRRHRPPVVGRIEDGMVLLDPRTVLAGEEREMLTAARAAFS
ncbi:MAG: L-seryl-tRNA(Sec) selenium transferase [SAR202 cluster bacterium]|nr:L-seryl-tRNA(Sec) selenium transferase [SAR202 cluster bacterium]